ncbi:OmpA family protein [Robbsia sp. Bb-Pol-6]|uniref:OmpA family protein n=1 Tax=Robbsia betulipollinis TaxID=2981849 RepID=A0ABT3ZJ45_9BURK|nr:OmpA family protein [Robbsia betulipollinis]MCY0386543.1 OmpA family protein [Robbsia betulipollinis]
MFEGFSVKKIGKARPLWLATVTAFALSGCANPSGFQQTRDGRTDPESNVFESTFANPDPCANSNRNIGIAVGAGLGAVLGAVIANKNKVAAATIAGAAGGLAGGLIGHSVDSRRCALSKIAARHDLTYTASALESRAQETGKTEQVGSSFTIVDTAQHTQFLTGSAVLTAEAAGYFAEIAEQYRTSSRVAEASSAADKAAAAGTKILLIGHTDDTGSSELNADLSERRARAVARLFASHGIAPENVFYQGAGETLPIADNHTEQGRSANRRVEIVDLAGARTDILQSYANSRTPKYQYYRAVTAHAEQVATGGAERATSGRSAGRAAHGAATDPSITRAGSPRVSANIATAANALPATAAASVRSPSANGIDFGWREVPSATLGLQFAALPPSSPAFSFLSSAVADEAPVAKSCINDRARVSRALKSVVDDRAVPVRDHLPNLYGSSWGTTLNGQYLALKDVSVLRNGTTAGARPTLLVWKNDDLRAGPSGTPQLTLSPEVNAYAVREGVLYRVFVNDRGVFDCADILFSNGKAISGELVRRRNDQYFTVNYVPVIART